MVANKYLDKTSMIPENNFGIIGLFLDYILF